MWVAKPLESLNEGERSAWIGCRERLRRSGEDTPLGQTLAWGEAVIAAGGRSYLIMNPEEAVGGLVHSFSGDGRFECVNGPLLKWEDSGSAPRQLATFATAVSKLSRSFSSMTLQPRWMEDRFRARLSKLPIEPENVSGAMTVHVSVKSDLTETRKLFSPRLRRSLSRAEQAGVKTGWIELGRGTLGEFVAAMRKFGESKGFFVPELDWFDALVFGSVGRTREKLGFRLMESSYRDGKDFSRTLLLICFLDGTAHYLFGCEEREGALRASISTSAAAHFRVLEECATAGVQTYDLNGYVEPGDGSHPYEGVSRFKSQFGGAVVRYVTPSFRIQI